MAYFTFEEYWAENGAVIPCSEELTRALRKVAESAWNAHESIPFAWQCEEAGEVRTTMDNDTADAWVQDGMTVTSITQSNDCTKLGSFWFSFHEGVWSCGRDMEIGHTRVKSRTAGNSKYVIVRIPAYRVPADIVRRLLVANAVQFGLVIGATTNEKASS